MASKTMAFTVTLGELAEVPGSPFAYWAPKSLRELFQKYPPLDRDVAGMLERPKIADVKEGLGTRDNSRFLRFWWEVPVDTIGTSREETWHGKKWVPFAKGGRPFYHDIQLVVNWENDGAEIKNYRDRRGRLMSRPQNESFYFRAGATWECIVSGWQLGVSFLPAGVIFGDQARSFFISDNQSLPSIIAFGNSQIAANLFNLVDPLAHHRSVGSMALLPISTLLLRDRLLYSLAHEAYDLLHEWDTGDETSTHFIAPWILQICLGFNLTARPGTGHPLAKDFTWSEWPSAKAVRGEMTGAWHGPVSLVALAEEAIQREGMFRRRLEEIQRLIDDDVCQLYGISEANRRLIEAELVEETAAWEVEDTEKRAAENPIEETSMTGATTLDVAEHIRRLLHYLAHRVITADPDGIVPFADLWLPDSKKEPGLAARVREELARVFGSESIPTLEEEIAVVLGNPLERWLAEGFFGYHLTLYRLRPIIWQLSSQSFAPRYGRRNEPAFSCFLYWHRLDGDTLYKVQHFYLRPLRAVAEREVERLAGEVVRAQGEAARVRRRREEEYQAALDRLEELSAFDAALSRLLSPHVCLPVESRSEWVRERVNELAINGYRPERDWGVRVNIEPLKQAGILASDAARVKG